MSLSSAVSGLHSYSAGRHSVVTSLVFPVCAISVGISPLSLCSYDLALSWGICYGIDYTFTSTSFISKMRSATEYLPGTNIYCLIATSFWNLDNCNNMCFCSNTSLNNYFILIDIQHPYDKCFPPIHIPKELFKILHLSLLLKSTALFHLEIILDVQTLFRIWVWYIPPQWIHFHSIKTYPLVWPMASPSFPLKICLEVFIFQLPSWFTWWQKC